MRHMITLLGVERGLSRTEAYMLCSVAGDLRMHEVVSNHTGPLAGRMDQF